ncbi:hypothetical protein CAI21_02840 [Alkalilimnicola ehrlichii]|uniref:Tetratricopeptide repeat protein n=1 Tax=Alkalilimnicola ehrlichii TaxID=351052 RepID=A0A3E0X0D5_9GAMM|nr:tetratricopeptide repeat protein [Alkalilimnicola ehrlichii]RFA30930.1 hypothetical protein CAI21_02840 [Alkalilimnicola ehrlichii]RFA38880.1 hypothetical protein CAL65_02975 [Alkalilimnicola ehrlichii]
MRNRAWYYLARTVYEKGLYEEAASALAEIEGELDMDLAGERQLLLALIRMERGDFAGAITALEPWQGSPRNQPYADYNRAIALIREGDRDGGVELLAQIGELRASDPELEALKDRANIAAGYALLEAEQPAAAQAYLARVRLEGPQSNQALLLAGLTESAQGRHREALAPWGLLRDRPADDPVVQQALLAIPQAHADLGAYPQAAALFEESIDILNREMDTLDSIMRRIAAGQLIAALALEEAVDAESGERAGIPGHRYLIGLLSGHHFQQSFQNFLDLRALHDNLTYWADSMDSFQHMLEAQHARYSGQVPETERLIAALDEAPLRERYQALQERLDAAEAEGDILSMATVAERRQWEQLREIDRDLTVLPPTGGIVDLQVGFWSFLGDFLQQLDADFQPRLDHLRQSLAEAGADIDRLAVRQRAAAEVQAEALARFERYQNDIAARQARLEATLPRVETALDEHRDYIQALALQELELRREHLKEQLLQARYALARVHDQATRARPQETSR